MRRLQQISSLLKSDGLPAYHLANVVSDHDLEMGITILPAYLPHVLRGKVRHARKFKTKELRNLNVDG